DEVTRLGFRIGQSAIGNLEAGKTESPRFLHELAMALRVTPHWLRTGTEAHKEKAVPFSVVSAPQVVPPIPASMAKDVPVLGTASGGNGMVMMRGDAIDHVRRPPSLNGRTDVFALYIEDVSMVPAFSPGDLVFVERRRPRVGDHAIIEYQDGPDAEIRVIIKKLAAVTSKAMRFQQYNPDRVLEIPVQHIVRMQRVMTMSDLFSV
ncbi:MAG: hypothetical protein RJB26_1328, partial [Pseudomonadota bacterium]